jgi:hypothetical protein
VCRGCFTPAVYVFAKPSPCYKRVYKEKLVMSLTVNVFYNPILFAICTSTFMSHGNIVGIASGYGLDYQGVGARVLVESRIFASPYHPDWLWGPPNLLSIGYRGARSPRIEWQGHEADGARVLVESRIFASPYHPDWLWGPPNLLSIGYQGARSPRIEWQGHEADHPSPASVEIQKTWIYTSIPICLHGVELS